MNNKVVQLWNAYASWGGCQMEAGKSGREGVIWKKWRSSTLGNCLGSFICRVGIIILWQEPQAKKGEQGQAGWCSWSPVVRELVCAISSAQQSLSVSQGTP